MFQCRLFFTALEYFTRWPKPRWVGYDPAWLGPCTRYFPVVGLIVGLCGALVYALATMGWSLPVAVVLSMAATVIVTGAFHEDGFADVCDGLGATGDRERIFQIMSDSRVGAFGAIGIGLMLLLKFVSLTAFRPELAVVAIIAAHVVSRAVPLVLMTTLPYARPQAQTKTKPVAQGVGSIELVIGILSAVLIVGAAGTLAWQFDDRLQTRTALWSWTLALSFAAALASAIPLRAWFRARLGGYTGDCLGASQQVSEVVFYLAMSALLGLH